MKVSYVDNCLMLYMEGSEDINALLGMLRTANQHPRVPVLDIVQAAEEMNCVPSIAAYHDETDTDRHLVSPLVMKTFRREVAQFHRDYVKGKKAQGERYGTREQREYAARYEAFVRAGEPQDIDWKKPHSIAIPDDIKREYRLQRRP